MTNAAAQSDIEVKHCSSLDEYDRCVEVEHLTWGESLAVPSAIFVVAHHTGGQVLAAFDGPKIVGFTLALAGIREGNAFLHSHMTAVLPDYQNRGIGRALKLSQRQDALDRGIGLIEWTFDPLEIKNAYFNLNRLGAVARRLIPNAYGVTKSPLHGGIPTDRLVAEWWLESERVRSAISGTSSVVKGAIERVTLPSNIAEIRSNDPASAERIQTGARGQLQLAFSRGHAAIGIEARGVRTDYILRPVNEVDALNIPAELTV
jgi:predicted GNAT superfamily acetyltransferase